MRKFRIFRIFLLNIYVKFKYDKVSRYLYLNLAFCMLSLLFIGLYSFSDHIIFRNISWMFILLQWVCVYFQKKEMNRRYADTELREDIDKYNL